METEVIHTTRKGKSILLFFPLILNYSVGSMVIDVFPIQTLIITPLRNVMLTVRELGLPVVSPGKGNQGTTRGKEKVLLTSVGIEPTTSGLDLNVTSHNTLIYTSELILSSTICVHSATRHNIMFTHAV